MTDDRRPTVLLIEDDDADAALVRLLLSRSELACTVERRNRLRLGLARLEAGGIDLVLLDFSLPDSFGLDSYWALRDRHPEVPVIVLTGLDDDALALQAVAEGAQDYLFKRTVDPPLLARAIRYSIERHRSELALRESEQRYALAMQGANDGIWDWDLSRNRVFLSPRWKAMVGFEEDELDESPESWFGQVFADDRERLKSAFDAADAAGDSHVSLEHRMRNRNGEPLWVVTRGALVRDSKGKVIRMAGSMTDISVRKRVEEQLVHDAFHDGLTGLANRSLFLDRVGMALSALPRDSNGSFAVLYLDLDRFKTINDSLGHSVGDLLLAAVARRLEKLLRPSDTVARLGGDEFAVLAFNVRDGSDAVHIAARMQQCLKAPFPIGGQEVHITASIGIALPELTGASADGLLRDADLAMYRSKAAGPGGCEVFDLELHRATVQLLKLETELRKGVAERDFVMHYQPIISLASGRIAGFEALTRWLHPERGLVSPSHFIALAEETGLIVKIGWLVLEQACRQACLWQERFPTDPPYFMSVNVSGKLFAQDGAVEQLLRILEASRLPPESLRLEVTESVVLHHGDEVMRRLRMLRDFGIQLSIDDFGTGYSSLSYLQRFHYDELKIDRSFVRDIEVADSLAIVETILSLANHLGIGVVAEGIETAEQLAHLRSLGCPHGQGFWFAQPLEPEAAEELLASNARW